MPLNSVQINRRYLESVQSIQQLEFSRGSARSSELVRESQGTGLRNMRPIGHPGGKISGTGMYWEIDGLAYDVEASRRPEENVHYVCVDLLD
jgi:hypothetical protein